MDREAQRRRPDLPRHRFDGSLRSRGASVARGRAGSVIETNAREETSLRFASPRGRWVLAVTVLGSSIAFLEATVVNVALPELGRDLGADVADLQWTINGYMLTLAAFILLGGSLGDRLGRRRVFNVGVAWFTLASALCALAPNVGVLIAARIVQGVGGALLTPASLAIIEATLHRDDRARAIGAWSGLSGIAAAVGPLVGGYLIEAVSWRAIFLINLPLGAFVIYQASRHVPETRDPTVTGPLDVRGSALAALALGGLTFALIQVPEQGIGSAAVVTAIALGILALAVFLRTERRSSAPMLPLEIFRSRQFTGANLVTFAVYAALGGVFFLLVVFLQVSLGYSPVAAGAASLPVTGLMLLLSSRAGALAQRIGPRRPLTVGALLIAVGMLMMREIDPGDGYVEAVLPPLLVYGLGLSAVVAPITATVLAAADANHAGVSSGVNNAVARTAQLAAVAVLPLVAGLQGTDYENPLAMADGFRLGMLATAALAAVGGVLAWMTIRDDVLEQAEEPGREPCLEALRVAPEHHCAVAGTPLHSAAHSTASEREPATVGAGRG
jgi:EmrB/QacA subfamily drug resistance transporter